MIIGNFRERLRLLGCYTAMMLDVIKDISKKGVNLQDLSRQITFIGTQSISIVFLTSVFSGAVLALQTAYGLHRFGAKNYVGNIVSLALVRELGPVLTGLMLCGRVGAGIAAEIGSMVVTEQVDAIKALGSNPIRKLVSPRIAAACIVLPLLAVMSNIFGILGGIFVAVYELNLPAYQYYRGVLTMVLIKDVMDGLIKSTIFGILFVSIACFKGLQTRGGTEGVGRSTTEAVVTGSIVILISDFFITKLLIILS